MKNNRRNFIKQMSLTLAALPIINLPSIVNGKSNKANNNNNFEYCSKFYKIKLSPLFPFIQYLSIDSLGKNKLSKNPILGSAPGAIEFELRRITANKVEFYLKSGNCSDPSWVFEFTPKQIMLKSNNTGVNDEQGLNFNINKNLNHATLLGLMKGEKKTMLPAILHFPDLGSFKVLSSNPQAIVDYEARRDVAQPYISISFPCATKDQHSVKYSFEVTAIYADFPGVEHPKYDGYRRNYINIFQVNPQVQGLANNSCSDAAVMTLYWPSIMALNTPKLIGTLTALDLLKMSLDRYINGLKTYGMVGYSAGGYAYSSLDSFPSLVISSCNYIIGSKDWKWADKNYPIIKGWLDGQMIRDIDNDGLVSYELSGNSGSWGSSRPANWWDTIGFGHDDAYSNAITFNALNLFISVSKTLKKHEEATNYQQLANKLYDSYYKTFFNSRTGVLAGWRSLDGHLHDYYFLMVNSFAVYYDLVPKENQKQIMQTLWDKMNEVGLTDFKYGLPGNLISVRREDYMDKRPRWGGGDNEDGSDAFQIYENGGLSANHAYYCIKAFQKAGLKGYADKIIDDMLVSFELGDFQGACSEEMKEDGEGHVLAKDWKDWSGNCWGYEGFLCDGYLAFLAMNPTLLT